jgi:hypothetical protein
LASKKGSPKSSNPFHRIPKAKCYFLWAPNVDCHSYVGNKNIVLKAFTWVNFSRHNHDAAKFTEADLYISDIIVKVLGDLATRKLFSFNTLSINKFYYLKKEISMKHCTKDSVF